MELTDIIYNVLLIVGIFMIGFFALGMILSKSQKKTFEDRFYQNFSAYPTIEDTGFNHFRNDNYLAESLQRDISNKNSFRNSAGDYQNYNMYSTQGSVNYNTNGYYFR